MSRPKGSKNKKEVKEIIKTDAVATTGCKATVSTKESVNPRLEALKVLMNEANRNAGRTVLKFAIDEETPLRAKFKNKQMNELTGGGLVHNRFNIIWGPKSAGKTTICLDMIAEAQKEGKICAFIDAEKTFDPKWAVVMGVDLSKLLLYTDFNNAEESMDIFLKLVKSNAVDIIFYDSIQAMSPKAEQETKKGKEKEMADDTMALLARKLSEFFRRSANGVYTSKSCIVLIGQARTNLGGFIAFDQLSGGQALHHWATFILNVRKGPKADAPIKKVKVDGKTTDEVIGFSCNVKIEKRKVDSFPEGTEISIPFFFEDGFPKD